MGYLLQVNLWDKFPNYNHQMIFYLKSYLETEDIHYMDKRNFVYLDIETRQ